VAKTQDGRQLHVVYPSFSRRETRLINAYTGGMSTGIRSYGCPAGNRAHATKAPCLKHTDSMCEPAADKKRNFVLVSCKLHIPEDVLSGCLERDAIRNTASLEHPQLQGNNTGTEHNPVVHIVYACGLDR